MGLTLDRQGSDRKDGDEARRPEGTVLYKLILPAVPIRPWVFTVPVGPRYLIAYDRELCGLVFSAFIRAAYRSLRRKAKAELGLARIPHGGAGRVVEHEGYPRALQRSTPRALRPSSSSTTPQQNPLPGY